MSSLSRNLRRATFAGVPFEVEQADLTFGRRTVVHEFPQRDTVFVEDMGKSTRKYTFNAFVCGSDYISRSKRLLQALETNYGPEGAALVHPWLGRLQVFPVETPKISWNLHLGYAKLELHFVEVGEQKDPSSLTSYINSLLDQANSLLDNLIPVSVQEAIEAAETLADDVRAAVGTALDFLENNPVSKALGFASKISDLAGSLTGLLSDTAKLADAVISTLGLTSLAGSAHDWRKLSSSTATLASSSALTANTKKAATVDRDIAPQATVTVNDAAAGVESAMRLTLLADAVASAAYIGSDYDQNDEGTQVAPGADEVEAVMADTLAALDTEMLLTDTDEADRYALLADCYAAVYQHLSAQASALGGMETVTPLELTSSLQLAYEHYEDASRDLEIVQRNNIPNPLFVPPVALRIAAN